VERNDLSRCHALAYDGSSNVFSACLQGHTSNEVNVTSVDGQLLGRLSFDNAIDEFAKSSVHSLSYDNSDEDVGVLYVGQEYGVISAYTLVKASTSGSGHSIVGKRTTMERPEPIFQLAVAVRCVRCYTVFVSSSLLISTNYFKYMRHFQKY
jgi:hypothetical protein